MTDMLCKVKKLYPDGKSKAFVLTYDDGVAQDIRLVELLNKYGLKASFNLNSGLSATGFVWTHECGMPIARLSYSQIKELYGGHEVASHTLTHPYLHEMSYPDVMHELADDKNALEQLLGREVRGFALPFLTYNDTIRKCAEDCGFTYARISDTSGSYAPERDLYALKAGAFHISPEARGFIDGFFASDAELAVCMLVGHSYDLEVCGLWDEAARVFKAVSDSADIASMTVIDFVDYITAMRKSAVCGGKIVNNGDCTLWFDVGGRKMPVPPGATAAIG